MQNLLRLHFSCKRKRRRWASFQVVYVMQSTDYFRFPGAAFRILPEFTFAGATAGLTMRIDSPPFHILLLYQTVFPDETKNLSDVGLL